MTSYWLLTCKRNLFGFSKIENEIISTETVPVALCVLYVHPAD